MGYCERKSVQCDLNNCSSKMCIKAAHVPSPRDEGADGDVFARATPPAGPHDAVDFTPQLDDGRIGQLPVHVPAVKVQRRQPLLLPHLRFLASAPSCGSSSGGIGTRRLAARSCRRRGNRSCVVVVDAERPRHEFHLGALEQRRTGRGEVEPCLQGLPTAAAEATALLPRTLLFPLSLGVIAFIVTAETDHDTSRRSNFNVRGSFDDCDFVVVVVLRAATAISIISSPTRRDGNLLVEAPQPAQVSRVDGFGTDQLVRGLAGLPRRR